MDKGPDVCYECCITNGQSKQAAEQISAPYRKKWLEGQHVKCEYCGKSSSVWKSTTKP